MNESILNIEKLSKSFSRKIINVRGSEEDEKFFIIKDFFLNVPKGKIMAIVGGNGAGKTTLFNIISGFVKPDNDNVTLIKTQETFNLVNLSPHKIARNGIGRLFQDNHIFPDLSVLENMLIACDSRFEELPFTAMLFPFRIKKTEADKIAKAKTKFDELLGEGNPLWQLQDSPAGNLSYGQQRLLGLARLFMQDYSLLLLDEPTAGVNQEIIQLMKKVITAFVEKGETVLLIEHNLKFVLDIADFCCFMSDGSISMIGTPVDVLENEDVKKSYLGL
ncbi:MAG: ABC transporter ATP-binding protein [Bacteroidales bacterium]